MKFKLLKDTTQTNGKYDHRKLTTLTAFAFCIAYALLGLKWDIKQWIFDGFLLMASGSMAMSIVNKLSVFDRFTKKKEDEV